MGSSIERLVRSKIRAMNAYHVPDSTGMIKLDAMENPYPWSESMVAAWQQELATVAINRYPDPQAQAVKAALKHSLNLSDEFDLLLGNGSDEIIQMIVMALAKKDALVMAPEPGFVMYRMIAEFVGVDYQAIPLANDFSLDIGQTLRAIGKYDPALIFLAFPNNPSGNLWRKKHLRKIIEACRGLVVIDEAYAPFSEKTFIDELGEYDNVVLMRTVSKMGLAGLRLGYLLGKKAWIDEFDKIRLPYNINSLTQVSAVFALKHADEFDRQAKRICDEREIMFERLSSMKGLDVFPSQANFILFRAPKGKADAIFESLKSRNVLIKNLSQNGGLLSDCLRVTVGTPEENEAFFNALQHALS